MPAPAFSNFKSLDMPSTKFDAKNASQAAAEGLLYLKVRLNWSGIKIAHVLHLAPNTLNLWLKKRSLPIPTLILHPDIQAVMHLLAIHRSLEAMFDEPEHQRAWLTTFHPELNAIPEELIAQSMEQLIYVRQYLDYVRGRGA